MPNNNRANIALRRQKVWILVCKGAKSWQIAHELGVTQKTVCCDIKFMIKDSHKYLNDMAKEMLPFLYKQSIEGMQQILLQCWKRFDEDHNSVWMKLAIDAQNSIFTQAGNGVSVSAIKSVTEK